MHEGLCEWEGSETSSLEGPSNKDGKSEPHEVGAERTPKAFGFEPTGLVG